MTAGTDDKLYFDRLVALQGKWWKRLIDVNAPYRWCLQSFKPGFTLDVGCGIGRSLHLLLGNGVGIDHNPYSVEFCRRRGYKAFTSEEFKNTEYCKPASFDSVLFSHVAEHMTPNDFVNLIREFLPYVRPGGKIITITPQEKGYASDATHVTFMDFSQVAAAYRACNLDIHRQKSFPFPRSLGRAFIYNEFVTVGLKPRVS